MSSASSSLSAAPPPAIVQEPEDTTRPIGFDVKESDVVVTGTIDSSRDPRPRKGDAKPGDVVDVARFACALTRKSREDEPKIVCQAAQSTGFGPEGNEFERRLSECFTVKSRSASAGEVAKLNAYLASDGAKPLEVPVGKLFAIERRGVNREEVIEYQKCPERSDHPCDPAPIRTGRFVDKPWVDVYAFAANGRQVLAPYQPWKLRWVELTRMPGPLDTVDLSTQPEGVRVAILYDRAVDAVRANDRKKAEAAVKALEAGAGDLRNPSYARSVATAVQVDLPTLRAFAEGRVTSGDACKR